MGTAFKDLSLFFHSGLGVVSAVVATLGTLVQLIQRFTKLRDLIGYRPLADQIRDEQARINETIEFMKKLESENSQESQTMREKLQINLNSMMQGLAALTDRDSKLRQDPNYGLNTFQRLFLLFGSEGGTAFIFRALTYICIIAIAVSLLYRHFLQRQATDVQYIADTLLLASYGALVFRAWALTARRWNYGYVADTSFWGSVFFLRRPRNKWTMAAQILLVFSIFWVVEGLEDLCFDVFTTGALPPLAEGLVKSLIPMAAAVLCRWWAGAESQYADAHLNRRRLAILLQFRWANLAMVAGIAAAAGLTLLVLRMRWLDDPMHQIAFVFQSFIVCAACSQLFAVLSQRHGITGRDPLLGKIESAAA